MTVPRGAHPALGEHEIGLRNTILSHARRPASTIIRHRPGLKFSILLPTRNRLEYLKLAVESVRRQDLADWQLVISDNCSEQDIEGYLSSIDDSRIVYQRTERPLAVTENWNRALALSEGKYIIMLGDDDALLPGYLSRMNELTREFDDPDLIYTKALLFTYPGVDEAYPTGSLRVYGCAEFFRGASAPFVLDHIRALEVVKAAMSFRLRYDFNAQLALTSRRLIDKLRPYGHFYQSAFPDYYSMNAAFLNATRIVVDPAPTIVIGVTPKSYGYFHTNHMEAEGRAFLDEASTQAPPGTNINIGWLSAITELEHRMGVDFGLHVNHRRYRFVQAAHVHGSYHAGDIDRDEVRRMERELPLLQRWGFRCASSAFGVLYRLPNLPHAAIVKLAYRLVGQLPAVDTTTVEGRYSDALEIYDDPAGTARIANGG
jgi:glycosyltransferase involved in cell wall biosynthesis